MSGLVHQRVALHFEPDKSGTVVAVALHSDPETETHHAMAEFYLLVQMDDGRLETWLAGNCRVVPFPEGRRVEFGTWP